MDTAGALLKSQREKKNKTLKDIADITKISITTLQALEGDRKEFLPPPSYVRGFIKTYAKELDLDPDEVLELYERELKHGQRWGAQKELAGSVNPAAIRRYMLIGAVLVVFGLILVFYIGRQGSTTDRAARQSAALPETVSEPAHGVPDTNAVDSKAVTDEVEPLPEPEREPVPLQDNATPAAPDNVTKKISAFTVRFATTELTWMRISVDEKKPFEILLRPGQSYSQTAEAFLKTRIGNPGGLSVFFNDQPVTLSGERGKPMDLMFPEAAGIKGTEQERE